MSYLTVVHDAPLCLILVNLSKKGGHQGKPYMCQSLPLLMQTLRD